MRTIVFSFLFFLTCALSSFAQDFRWGVVGGLNLGYPKDDQLKTTLFAGVKGYLQLKGNYYLYSGLQLQQNGFKEKVYIDNGVEVTFLKDNPHYLSVPIHLGYRKALTDGSFLSLTGGPYVAYGLFGKRKVEAFGDTYSGNLFKDGVYRRWDMGLGVALNWEYTHLTLGLGADWGLLNQASYFDRHIKRRDIYVSVGYYF